jgi:hypothetical protein
MLRQKELCKMINRCGRRSLAGLCSCLTLLLLLAGCAASTGTSTAFLLEQDYQRMSDAQLTAYEQELSDVLARSAGSAPGGVSVGFGLGSWGSSSGVGVGVGQTIGGGSDGDAELRARRDAVRAEMRRRGLLP